MAALGKWRLADEEGTEAWTLHAVPRAAPAEASPAPPPAPAPARSGSLARLAALAAAASLWVLSD